MFPDCSVVAGDGKKNIKNKKIKNKNRAWVRGAGRDDGAKFSIHTD